MSQEKEQDKKRGFWNSPLMIQIVIGVFGLAGTILTYCLTKVDNVGESENLGGCITYIASFNDDPARIHEEAITHHYYRLDTSSFSLDCEILKDPVIFNRFQKNTYFEVLKKLKDSIPHSIDRDYYIKDKNEILLDEGQLRTKIPGFDNLIGVFKDGIKRDSNGNIEYYIITRIPKRARDLYPGHYEEVYNKIREYLRGSELDLDAIYGLISGDRRIMNSITVIAEEYEIYLYLIRDYLFLRLAERLNIDIENEFPKAEYELTYDQELSLRLVILQYEEKLKKPYYKGKKFTILCKGSSTLEPVREPILYDFDGYWNQYSTPIFLEQKGNNRHLGKFIEATDGDKDGNIQLSYARAHSGITYIKENLLSAGDDREEKLNNISFAYQGLGVADKRKIVIELIEQ